MNKVTINQGRVLPLTFRFFMTISVFGGMALSMQHFDELVAVISCIVISFFLPLAWSSYYIVQIRPEEHEIHEGYWIMGLKKMSKRPYETIEKIYINANSLSQRATSYAGQTATFSERQYQAFLKTSDGYKVELISSKSESDLMDRLKPIAKKLQTTIQKNYQ
ncbi:hypothetical protein [Marinoscillum sp.]|uniref:hypothetical protein n=1 Tax=Marinoscillum sp. TaxID=2024838 RepID=UPI003BA93BC3